jgi:ABC-type lipoprotein export system ATPase subunit
MLLFENVTKEFRLDEETTITPVRDVDLQIKHGEFIVIVGRSGTGKTTLLNLTAGLVRPTKGRVKIDDIDLASMGDKEISSLRTKKIGFIFQFPSLLPALTVKENISLPTIFVHGSEDKYTSERAVQLLNTLGLGDKLDVYPRQLSAGEQKRTIIARSLMNQPKLVLADEPTSDLDNHTEQDVMRLLRDINTNGVTFLIVTHNLELINFATRAFEMENGRLNSITALAT